MKRRLRIPILVTLFALFPLIAFCGAEQAPPESYYQRLKSLVKEQRGFPVQPKPTERDVNRIELEKGAAGVVFGASMDEVIAVWGKPEAIWIDGVHETWYLGIAACRFGFINNRLCTISILSPVVKDASMDNGIDFGSSYEDILSVFGKPVEVIGSTLRFVTEEGYGVTFTFDGDEVTADGPRLIAIEISCPSSRGRGRRSLQR